MCLILYRFLVGPPVGGALYNTFGFRGPFIFAIIVTMIDFVGRLLIIERKDALPWGIDPAAIEVSSFEGTLVQVKLISYNRTLRTLRKKMRRR